MTIHKMHMPVMFWRAVEDVKDLSNSKTRQSRVTQVVRKFFSKHAKYGMNAGFSVYAGSRYDADYRLCTTL